MNLFENKEYFQELIRRTSLHFGINISLVEKDFYIVFLLKKAFRNINGLVFKGGTSLSKCQKTINRFSEDIDLTLDLEHSSQTFKRNSLRQLIELCDENPFKLINKDTRLVHTHANYNCFNIDYPVIYQSKFISMNIKMEMVYLSKCYPSEKSTVCSYIGEYLISQNNNELLKEYDLEPFQVKVQSLNRTLVDKVFAICDYFLRNEVKRNSRHIYDIDHLLTKVELDDDLKVLIKQVRDERKKTKRCVSAQDGVSVNKIINQIIETNFYKEDYENVTSQLLFKDYKYEDAIKSLFKIIKSNVFEENNNSKRIGVAKKELEGFDLDLDEFNSIKTEAFNKK